jgi:hypothetical protein
MSQQPQVRHQLAGTLDLGISVVRTAVVDENLLVLDTSQCCNNLLRQPIEALRFIVDRNDD